MDENKGQSEQPTNAASDEGNENGQLTLPGQIIQSISRATRPLTTATERERRPAAQASTAALRERITTLIGTLGDPNHPLHQRAVEDLVTIGPVCVPQLCDMLNPQRPWLMAYRAAEALGRIGDGRAAGPLLEALRHPNSNVRWSAVRALASVGDARALLELRRIARNDTGKTSWGESVGGAAQSVLDQMQDRNILLRGADLVKTAIACVFMLVALILAWTFVTALREEFRQISVITQAREDLAPIVRTALPTPIPRATAVLPVVVVQPTQPAITPTPASELAPPDIAPDAILATVIASGNVRALPTRGQNNVIGSVNESDEVIVIASTADRQWYRIALGQRRAASSRINSESQSGWVARSLLSPITATVPIEDALPAEPTAIPPAEPTALPAAEPTLTPSP